MHISRGGFNKTESAPFNANTKGLQFDSSHVSGSEWELFAGLLQKTTFGSAIAQMLEQLGCHRAWTEKLLFALP